CLSQLNRQLEYRSDKRPMLADLRESGCLVAETEIALADGSRATIGELFATGATDLDVLTLDEHLRLVPGRMTHVFESGTKAIFELQRASGRHVVASANHPFLTIDGWVHLGDLEVGTHVASSRAASIPVDMRHDQIPREIWDYVERKSQL